MPCVESNIYLSFLSRDKEDSPSDDLAWEHEYLECDICGKVAFEIVCFLRRKYPEKFDFYKKGERVLGEAPDYD